MKHLHAVIILIGLAALFHHHHCLTSSSLLALNHHILVKLELLSLPPSRASSRFNYPICLTAQACDLLLLLQHLTTFILVLLWRSKVTVGLSFLRNVALSAR